MSFKFLDTTPRTEAQESEYMRLLGYPPDHVAEERARELASWARAWFTQNGNPWIYARLAPITELKAGKVTIGNTVLTPGRLYERLVQTEAESVMLVAVSAGRTCEEAARKLWTEGKPDEYFFLEVYGSAVVEHLLAAASFRLCAWADERGVAVLPHYSPGYPEWGIQDQQALWKLITREESDLGERLEVLETGMLRPKKSLLAVFGITRHLDTLPRLTDLIPCENCSLPSCRYRRAPQKYPLPRLEEIRRWQPTMARESGDGSAKQPDVRYTVNPTALRKWSKERLVVNVLPDKTIEAQFRYDGTTCSNLGRPLAFDYQVRLAPSEPGYVILKGTCAPAEGDSGHKHMCDYIKDAPSLLHEIHTEEPLAGKLLNEVFAWKRPYDPAACFCSPESRQHKWGIVFEVLHFALEGPGRDEMIPTPMKSTFTPP